MRLKNLFILSPKWSPVPVVTRRQRPVPAIKIIHILRSKAGIAEQNETARIAAGRI